MKPLLPLSLLLPLHLCAQAPANGGATYPVAGTRYVIDNAKTANCYISEEADGSLVVAGYDVSQRCFWEFIPTEKEHCYYIRNSATGKYVQSCNKRQHASSTMTTGEQPVEYYVGYNNTSGTASYGACYLSSTDNANYAIPGQNPNALNKDGASSNVIVWGGQPSNKGSYWNITPTEDSYEVKPFISVPALGNVGYPYDMVSPSGQCLVADEAGELSWVEKSRKGEEGWYFVGESNQSGGYAIGSSFIPGLTLSVLDGRAALRKEETPTRWVVFEKPADNTLRYYFRPADTAEEGGTGLTVAGDSLFSFRALPSAFARSMQIYQQPCGTLGNSYVTSAQTTGEAVLSPLRYPATELSGSQVVTGSTAPASWHTLFTRSKATVAIGKSFELTLRFNRQPADGAQAFVYSDWDRDGVFETMQPMTLDGAATATIDVPSYATAGQSRMRVRLTENGLTDAEDEVTGQIIDFIVCAENSRAFYIVKAVPNAADRGTVALTPDGQSVSEGTECTATATPLGNAEFLCWKESGQVVSTLPEYVFTVQGNVTLTACFTPDTTPSTGISDVQSGSRSFLVSVTPGKGHIDIETSARIRKVRLYHSDGTLISEGNGKRISTGQLPAGTYIVKVYAEDLDASSKIFIR